MNIYFACSIRSGREDLDLYADLVKHIKYRAVVLSEIFADGKLTAHGSPGKSEDIYSKDIKWLKQADAIIAEVTNPSLGVGYEIAKGEELGKPILALFRDDGTRRLSAMIDGSPKSEVFYYKQLQEALMTIDRFIDSIV
jgi:nucleoside 2-deoxyribosyltransferase